MTDEEIKLDLLRGQRVGFGEAVFCEQKTPAQIEKILELASEADAPMLFTRLSPAKHVELSGTNREQLDYDPPSATAFFTP